MEEINFFAKTNFRNQERVFGIKRDDRRRHMYVIGKTGMGKSSMLENMAIQDIQNGEGICVVDPHGEFAEKMVSVIPNERVDDIIYFNPADKEFPLAFNILESVDEDKKNLVASGMMGVFKKIWPDVWSPRMEYILNNTILALLDYPGSTMLGVNRMMSDKDYRKRVYPKIKDPVVKSFWLNEFDKWDDRFRKEAVAAIQNKVGQFLSSAMIRHIVGQPKSTIDMEEIMNQGKILIVNLSKGRIGEDVMRLLGGMIITKIQLAAMGRVNIPEEERKDFYLYVDEFQNFATESFANILSEARKYRLSLILAHQYVNQLIFDGNTTVRDSIFGNVGTLVSFRVGAEDGEQLEKEFDPVFLMNDIVNLSKYHIYLKLMIDGIAGDAFSAITLPPTDITQLDNNKEKIIKASREQYSQPRAVIEEKIARWSGMFLDKQPVREKKELVKRTERGENKFIKKTKLTQKKEKEEEKLIPKVKYSQQVINSKQVFPEEKELKVLPNEKKQLFKAVCDTCGEKIKVPFKPDPARPTFCRECLRDYQRYKALDKIEKEKNQKIVSKITNKNQLNKKNSTLVSTVSEDVLSFDPQSKSLTLNQMSHMTPKKFSRSKKKKTVNLKEIKDLINKAQKNNVEG